MKLKSLVLGTAAGALAVTGAQAADLPVAPEPIDYVRVCDAFGPGFYFIPGTETCLSVAGRIRVDYNYFDFDEAFVFAGGGRRGTAFRGTDAYRFRARAYLYMDSRTNTEFGLLRTFTEAQWTFDSGSAGQNFGALNDDVSFIGSPSGGSLGLTLNRAFIQFGGLTFGRTQSFYDFTDAAFGSSQLFNADFSDTTTNLAAYTFAFGNGFSASISVEDETARRNGPFPGSTVDFFDQNLVFPDLIGFTFGSPFFPVFDCVINPFFPGNCLFPDVFETVFLGGIDTVNAYAGTRYPDVVGNLRVDQAWGSAQIMGAGHFVQAVATEQSEYGFAVGAGVTVNVPLGTGTQFGVQGGYTNGALSYVASGPVGPGVADATVDVDGNLNLVNAWSVSGGFGTSITPTISLGVQAGYLSVDHDDTTNSIVAFDTRADGVFDPFVTTTTTFVNNRDFNNLDVDAILGYEPVDGMVFNLGVQYKRVSGLQGGTLIVDEFDALGFFDRDATIQFADPDSFDAFNFFFRAQRTF